MDEKTFLANEALEISKEVTLEADNSYIIGRISRRYKIPFNTIKGWVAKVSNGIVIPNRTGGRPPAMDQEAGARFIQTLKERRESKDAVPFSDMNIILGQGVTDTKLRQGKRGASAVGIICMNTRKKLFKLYNVVTVKPQILTDARIKSCSCPRLSYIWGCVLMAYSSSLLAENKWNTDSPLFANQINIIQKDGLCLVKTNKRTVTLSKPI